MSEVNHGPTRANRSINTSCVNFSRSVSASGTSTPLETEDGAQSAHRVAFFEATFSRKSDMKVTYSYIGSLPRKTGLHGQGKVI